MRIAAVSLLLVLVPVATCPAAQPRRAAVLAAVQEAIHAKAGEHFNSRDVLMTGIEKRRFAAAGRSIWVPVLPPHCGTGMVYGGLDVEAARRLAGRLCKAYGYERDPQPILDLLAKHCRCMQHDTRTPLLACALTLVDVLNRATRGEDVDLAALAGGRTVELPLPNTVAGPDGNAFFVAEKPATLTLAFTPPKGGGDRGIGLLVLPFYGPGRRFELLQDDLRVTSACAVFVTPPTFDAGKPFRIRVHHDAGQVHLGAPVTLRVP